MSRRWKIVAAAVLTAALGAAAPAAAGTVEHRVRTGDNLHLIAGYYYKNPRLWGRIWRANRERLRSANLLPVGAVLRVELEDGPAWDVPYEEFVALVRRPR